MLEPLFLTPVFQERIWGGTALRERFGYNIPFERTGECWAVSAHPNGASRIAFGALHGMTLKDVWDQHPSLFGLPNTREFPLLIKILDANDDLSVQVHPDDTYASLYENESFGKTECWYILDCTQDARLILGHTAQTKKELKQYIDTSNWKSLLTEIPIKPGDFFFVPSGTVHALGKGTLVLEVQQSSDVTYRLYDYDRIDEHGKKRDLHLDKATDVICVPNRVSRYEPTTIKYKTHTFTTLIESRYFSVYKVNVHSSFSYKSKDKYLLLNVLSGAGSIISTATRYSIKCGDHLLIPYGFGSFTIEGNTEIIISHP